MFIEQKDSDPLEQKLYGIYTQARLVPDAANHFDKFCKDIERVVTEDSQVQDKPVEAWMIENKISELIDVMTQDTFDALENRAMERKASGESVEEIIHDLAPEIEAILRFTGNAKYIEAKEKHLRSFLEGEVIKAAFDIPKQAVIDPITGRDVTGEYASAVHGEEDERMQQLITDARKRVNAGEEPQEIFDELHLEIEDIVAAAAGAMKLPPDPEKIEIAKQEFAETLGISYLTSMERMEQKINYFVSEAKTRGAENDDTYNLFLEYSLKIDRIIYSAHQAIHRSVSDGIYDEKKRRLADILGIHYSGAMEWATQMMGQLFDEASEHIETAINSVHRVIVTPREFFKDSGLNRRVLGKLLKIDIQSSNMDRMNERLRYLREEVRKRKANGEEVQQLFNEFAPKIGGVIAAGHFTRNDTTPNQMIEQNEQDLAGHLDIDYSSAIDKLYLHPQELYTEADGRKTDGEPPQQVFIETNQRLDRWLEIHRQIPAEAIEEYKKMLAGIIGFTYPGAEEWLQQRLQQIIDRLAEHLEPIIGFTNRQIGMYDDVFKRLAIDPMVAREIFEKGNMEQFRNRQSKRLETIFNKVSMRKAQGEEPIRLFDEFLVTIDGVYAIPGAGSWIEREEQEQKLATILGLDYAKTMKRML